MHIYKDVHIDDFLSKMLILHIKLLNYQKVMGSQWVFNGEVYKVLGDHALRYLSSDIFPVPAWGGQIFCDPRRFVFTSNNGYHWFLIQ